jgi:hypothetical protein
MLRVQSPSLDCALEALSRWWSAKGRAQQSDAVAAQARHLLFLTACYPVPGQADLGKFKLLPALQHANTMHEPLIAYEGGEDMEWELVQFGKSGASDTAGVQAMVFVDRKVIWGTHCL